MVCNNLFPRISEKNIIMRFLSLILLISITLLSCNNEHQLTVTKKTVKLDDIGYINKLDSNANYQIIPLEGHGESMINSVDKLIITSSGIFVLDLYPEPSIRMFSHDGSYMGKIGALGHSKSEVSYILDFCTNAMGDSIYLLQYDEIKVFNNKGKYLSTIKLNETMHCEKIVCVDNKFVCSSNYTGVPNLVNICDDKFAIEYKQVETNGYSINQHPYMKNPIWCSHGKIIYCDFFSSSFYVTDMKTFQTVCYELESDNLLKREDATLRNWDNRDHILKYYFDGRIIKGSIAFGNTLKNFELDLKNETCNVFLNISGVLPVDAYYNGLYYTCADPESLLRFVETCENNKQNTSLYNEIKKYKVSSNDNYYIIMWKNE